ncbi:MAG: DNA-binding transcriptional regulator [Pirellulales bacterium]
MKRQVALIIETSSVYGRNVLSGIVRHMRMHDEWSVFLEQRDLFKNPPAWLNNWQGDGIISRATTPQLLAAISKTGVPFIDLTDRYTESNVPSVRSDDAAIGAMGAEHLMERGFERFGFCGFKNEEWSQRREAAFKATIQAKLSTTCASFNTPWQEASTRPWQVEQKLIEAWLISLAPPFAIMACNDIRGQHVIDACLRLGLDVPEQVSVLGVDNDELLCRLCSPPLSSVVSNAEGVGLKAAEMLSDLMAGKKLRSPFQAIPPVDVAIRQSTDAIAIEDRSIATALRYIREHACRGLTVEEVVQQTAVSRSSLERKLRKLLGRTPQEEIRHVQINRARELLATTDLSAERIAELCGFEHPEYLHVVFKRVTGLTPGRFRRQAKP